MNDLRSPSEDRPYRTSARLHQDDVATEYDGGWFDTLRQNRWFPLASVLAAVLIFSGIVSYAYKQGSQTGVNATTPVVAAEGGDYKEKPENPGGMDVPFQDAVVFDQLQDKGTNPEGETIESLLPAPEQPVNETAAAPEAAKETAKTETAPAADAAKTETKPAETAAATPVTETVAPAPEAQALVTDPAAPAAVTETTTEGTLTAPAEKTAEEKAAEEAAVAAAKADQLKKEEAAKKAAEAKKAADAAKAEAAAAAKKAQQAERDAATAAAYASTGAATASTPSAAAPVSTGTAVSSGTYRIQLGAFRDEAAARAAWNAVKSQHSQLSGVTPDFPRADLGAKGVFYRAQGTNLSKESADEMCRVINAGKAGSCIVTH